MTPDPSFVKDLTSYDPKLRVRWAANVEKWFLERKVARRNATLRAERPSSTECAPADGIRRDLWEGWVDGYVHVLTVPPESLHWSLVVESLAKADSWRMGSFDEINRKLDEDEEQSEKQADKRIDNYVETATDDAYEHMAWFTGRRVAVNTPEPALVDTGLGFKVRDKRRQ